MPDENLIKKQQAAYVAATCLDNGDSPRSASKVADYSRRETMELAQRREANEVFLHTQQVILEYLQATVELGMGSEERTPEAVAAAFPVATPEAVARDIRLLNQEGWRESNGYARNQLGTSAPRNLTAPWRPPEFPDEMELEELDFLNDLPLPPLNLAGTGLLKEAALYQWAFRKPRPDHTNYIRRLEWPGYRPRIVSILSDAVEEAEAMEDYRDFERAMDDVADATRFLLPFITEPATTRILCNVIERTIEQPTPRGHAPWPSDGTLYAELETPLKLRGSALMHGLVAIMEPAGENPDFWLVGLVCENKGKIYIPVASVNPDTGETRCTVVEEHECHLDTELHLKLTQYVAEAVDRPLREEHLTRQQRRFLQRKGWPNLWLIAENTN